MSIFGRLRGYCPHPPMQSPREHPLYYKNSWLSPGIRDFGSSLDGLVGFAILYGLLFAVSFIALPNAGLAEQYQFTLLRVCSAIFASLLFVYGYARLRGVRFLRPEFTRARWSLIESFLAVLVWGGLWLSFGVLSNSYFVKFDSTRLLAVPLSLTVGFLGGLIVYGYCAPRFQQGVGKWLGVIMGSSVGALLFFAASMDYAFSFLPLIVLLVYVGARTDSPIGPVIFTTLLFGLFYLWPIAPSIMSSLEPTYGSILAAALAGLFLFGLARLQPGGEGTR